MKKHKKRLRDMLEQRLAINEVMRRGFDQVMQSIEQKGFDQMVRESFIVPFKDSVAFKKVMV